MNSSIARERITFVVKPDSITASQGDFLATHVAIKRLHLINKFDILPAGGEEHSEDTVYKSLILNPDNRHQFIAVYGQSGTGKSHLIRWFETKYKYDKPNNEVVLFIRRSDNTLKGTIRQLLAIPEVQEMANKEIYDRLVRAAVYEDENKLKGRIYHDFINEIENNENDENDDESHDIRLTNVKRKRLIAFLNNEVVKYHLMSLNGPIERIFSKVADKSSVDRDVIAQFITEDFLVSSDLFEDIRRVGADPKAEKMARELMADDSGVEDARKIANYLNQFVNDVIQRCAGIEPGDFRDIFQDIRRELFRAGKNLTLFIEDVTSFTGVDDALLDALIVEHTGMNAEENLCRISSIVGTTSNYLQTYFRDNHKDRITQYVYIPSDAFDEEGIFEFVGRYINAMSLPESTVTSWIENHAATSDYPVHDVKEGTIWEFVPIEFGKQLCLYPFTKNSIRYLYRYVLTRGQQTPRYIIRDIIEPVVNDILNNRSSFPSIKYNIVNVNTTLSVLIHNQIRDEEEAGRLLRFLSIWGDGTPDQYTKAGIKYVSAVRRDILEDLGFPVLSLSQIEPPKPPESDPKSGSEPQISSKTDSRQHSAITEKNQERVNKVTAALSNWVSGQGIDASATVGTSGVLRAAQEDICDYLMSSINWQAEGVSIDNMTKIKNSDVRMVTFDKQAKLKMPGFYIMYANWDSLNVISAFVRWREFGSQSWNYPESDLDAYLITSWSSQIKESLIKTTSEYATYSTSYIEAAIAAEIYRMILFGEYREKSLKNLTAKDLFEKKAVKDTDNYHSDEWKSLVRLLAQKGADTTNRETVRQYFNIPQGHKAQSSTIIVLDEPNLIHTLCKVKTNKLSIPEDAFEVQDSVKRRQDVFAYLKDINDRLDSVAKAEITKARSIVQQIFDNYSNDEIDEDDILELVSSVKDFYDEINSARFSVAFYSSDTVKKNADRIAKAINDIGEVLDENDPLTILMTFAGDPIADLQPLMDLFEQLDKDFEKVNKQLETRRNALGDTNGSESSASRYTQDTADLNMCLSLFNKEALV